MRCARALPISTDACGQLHEAPVATPRCRVDFPKRLSDRTSSATRTSGTLSIIMSPDHRPCTQIRLGAGTRNPHSCRIVHGR